MRPAIFRAQVWAHGQRLAIVFLLSVLSLWLMIRLLHDHAIVPEKLPTEGPRAGELLDHLDLNTADATSLSAIPHLGEQKAKSIVAYREKFTHEQGGRAFEQIEDLYRIKGIGAATVAEMRQFVVETTGPTTKP